MTYNQNDNSFELLKIYPYCSFKKKGIIFVKFEISNKDYLETELNSLTNNRKFLNFSTKYAYINEKVIKKFKV